MKTLKTANFRKVPLNEIGRGPRSLDYTTRSALSVNAKLAKLAPMSIFVPDGATVLSSLSDVVVPAGTPPGSSFTVYI